MITITLPRATVEQALEALAPWMDSDHTVQHAAYHALRTALAQQAEPVEPAFHGFMSADGTRVDVCFTPSAPRSDGAYATAYYTTPPQRKPLTDEEIEACRQQGYAHAGLSAPFDFGKAARAVERKVRGDEA